MRRSPFLLFPVLALVVFTLLPAQSWASTPNADKDRSVLFYLARQGENKYNIDDQEDGGYTFFAQTLRGRGYLVAGMTSPTLSYDKIQDYDVIILQSLSEPLSSDEFAALMKFVNSGGSLFINGGLPPGVNTISQAFGFTEDGSRLLDPSNPITHSLPSGLSADAGTYVATSISDHPSSNGVSSFGVYGGAAFIVSSTDVKVVATCSDSCYTETGSFPVGSRPPLAVTSKFGKSTVFAKSDVDMLANGYIRHYDNLRFGLNVINWLATEARQARGSTSVETSVNAQRVFATLDGFRHEARVDSASVVAERYIIHPHESVEIVVSGSGSATFGLHRETIGGIYRVTSDKGTDLPYSVNPGVSGWYEVSADVPSGTGSVIIYGAEVIPEFPFALLVVAIAIGTATVVGRARRLF